MTQRYHLLLRAALLALAPALAAPVHAEGAAKYGTAEAFSPPDGPLVLVRELRKGFGQRNEFVSRRRYEIRFIPDSGGWRVDGTLIASEVDVPPGMAPQLAELERTRSDAGLFPMHLDRMGRIVLQQGSGSPAEDARTLAAARAVLDRSALDPAERAAALEIAGQLQAQARAGGGNWPADLFHPAPGRRSETRSLPLGAGEGKVTIVVEADGDSRGLLGKLQRRIVTEAGGTSRLSIETWTLSAPR